VKIRTRISTAGIPNSLVPSIIRDIRACLFAAYRGINPASLPTGSAHRRHPDDRMARCLCDDRAFTLIELIVVTALIAIMLAVAIPRLDREFLSNDSDKTARWIIANVRNLKEKAITDQKTYLLNISPDTRLLWIGVDGMSEEDADAAREKGYRLPKALSIDHVAFSPTEQFSSGTISIRFYAAGYSDKAVIRIRTNDGDRLSFFIEPFLPEVNLVRGAEGWRS
jgi:general secretion pathway protein H